MPGLTEMKQVLLSFDAAWITWLLLLMGGVIVAISVERLLLYRVVQGDVAQLSEDLYARLRQRDYAGAIEHLSHSRSAAAAVTIAGLKHADLGPAAAEQAIVGATALQRVRLERGLAFLGTLGNNAPFIGLMGTVVGIIRSFEALGQKDAAASQLAPDVVMSGIAEALVATAVGLMVAIPAVIAFNYFQRRVTALLAVTSAVTSVLLAHLHGQPTEKR